MIELPFFADPVEVYRRVADLGDAVLLESAGTTPQARWDIVAAGSTRPNSRILSSDLSSEQTIAAVEDLSQQLHEGIPGTPSPAGKTSEDTPPFTGGYVGHLSYELGRRLHGLPPKPTAMPLAVVRAYPWAIAQDRKRRRSYLVGDCPDLLVESVKRRLAAPKPHAQQHDGPFELTAPFEHPWRPEAYSEVFDRVRAYLLDGDCYQINIGQPFKAPYRGDLLSAYASLRDVANAPFSAYFPLDGENTLLSFSPERFLQVENGVVETRPIKGTRPRYPDPQADQAQAQELLNSPKERAENLMIVDLLRNDLGRFCTAGSVCVEELYRIESYATVHHLTSVIRGTLRPERSALDLLLGSIPGGSITGAPKRRAMQIIDELEPDARQAWCGNVFYLSRDGRLDSSITIRSLFADGESLTCWAGGGLVIDSEAAAEYQEQRDKVGALLARLEAGTAAGSELGQLKVAE